MSDFDSELEKELHRLLDPIVSGPIPTRRAVAGGGLRRRLLGGAGAALTIKVLTGVAVAAAAVTVAGAATEVATTGSLNPLVWGQQVNQTVQQCKDTLRASGTRGIGKCVSAFTDQHGATTGDHGKGNAKDHSKDKGKGHGGGADKTPGSKPKDNGSRQPGQGGQVHTGPPPVPGA
jgi:hypothetical protein